MSVGFKWNKSIVQILDEATGGKNTLLFMASEAKRLMDPYVPALSMNLSQNISCYVDGDEGIVHYNSPYARFQHEGIVMVSKITGSPWARYGEGKVTTGRKLNHNRSKHPLATSHWEKAMMTARGQEYIQSVNAYIHGGKR